MQTRRFLEFGRSDRVIERVWWKCRAKQLFEGDSWPTITSTYGHAPALDSPRNGLFGMKIRKERRSSPVYIMAEPVQTYLPSPSPPGTPISTYLSLPACFPQTLTHPPRAGQNLLMALSNNALQLKYLTITNHHHKLLH